MATLHLRILTKCLFCALLTFKYIHFAQHTMTSCAPSNRQKDQSGLVQDWSLSKQKKWRIRTNASPTGVGPGSQSSPWSFISPRTGFSNTRCTAKNGGLSISHLMIWKSRNVWYQKFSENFRLSDHQTLRSVDLQIFSELTRHFQTVRLSDIQNSRLTDILRTYQSFSECQSVKHSEQ